MRTTRYILAFLILWMVDGNTVFAQGFETQFGKNRVQYHNDFKDWWMYESENFITYWYGKARNVAHASMQLAEMDYEEIVNIIEHRTNQKIEIIAYVDITDVKQSNIGNEDQFALTAGKTKIVGNKLFVHFNGDHQDLRRQIRKGMATIILDAMLYGGSLQEIVQNAVFLNVPDWFRDGLISHIATGWDSDQAHKFNVIQEKNPELKFKALAFEYPEVIGHSFWYFISERYGVSTIANLLYLTRINRNLENAFLYVIGTSLNRLIDAWKTHYEGTSNLQISQIATTFPFKLKRNQKLTHLKTHLETGRSAFVTNHLGKARVFLEKDKRKVKCLFSVGYCNRVQQPDNNYPLIEWSPSGRQLHIIYEKRDRLYYRVYDMKDLSFEEQILPNDIQRIYDFAPTGKGKIYFSGSNNALSDIFVYTPRSRQYVKITDDYHDDLEVEYFEGENERGVLFTSGRTSTTFTPNLKLDTILPLSNRNIFYYSISDPPQTVIQVTDSKIGDKRDLTFSGTDLYYLSNKSGFWNKRKVDLNEVWKVRKLGGTIDYGFDGTPVSTYPFNIHLQFLDSRDDQWYDIIEKQGKYELLPSGEKVDFTRKSIAKSVEADQQDLQKTYDLNYFDAPFNNPEFESQNINEAVKSKKEAIAASGSNISNITGKYPEFNFAQAVASRVRFKIDFFNTNLDNTLMFGGLDTYAGTKREFENPPLGILLKANLKDIFEDYVVEGGTRITTSFNGSEHFLTFIDKKYRVDKHYSLYRRSVKNLIDQGEYQGYRGRNVTFIGVFQLRYPFDVYRSLRASTTFRNDKFSVLSTNRQSLDAPTLDEQRLGMKLEYVFDNTLNVDVNILNGIRYKAYIEGVKRFELDFSPATLNVNDGWMAIIGGDARMYIPVLKHSVLAFRAHGATSFGAERVLFYAGGMENWLFPSFNNNTSFPQDDSYAYQTIATNIRGFEYNIRNGGTFAILSSEFRLPIMRYLTRRKIKFAPLHHLQLSGFFDMGMAWFGTNPLADDNPANSGQFSNPAVTVDVQYYRDPLIMGYGWGVRTLIFGYYLKFDYAWGIETRQVRDPMWYLSLGMDF